MVINCNLTKKRHLLKMEYKGINPVFPTTTNKASAKAEAFVCYE